MSASLASNILAKKPKVDNPIQRNDENEAPDVPAIIIPQENEAEVPNFDLHFDLEELDDAPNDDVLNQFLDNFEQLQANANAVAQPAKNPQQALVPMNHQVNVNAPALNIQNVQNNPNKVLPAMYFPGSNVTINYNFGK